MGDSRYRTAYDVLAVRQMAELKVTGLEDLDRRLSQLPRKMQTRVLGNATRAAARVIRDAAKRNVPKRTGALHRAIKVKGKRLRSGTYVAKVGLDLSGHSTKKLTDQQRGYYGLFLEFGTSPYTIRAKRGGFLWFGGRGHKVIHHPGITGRHWMERAVRTSGQRAIDVFGAKMIEGLDKQVVMK